MRVKNARRHCEVRVQLRRDAAAPCRKQEGLPQAALRKHWREKYLFFLFARTLLLLLLLFLLTALGVVLRVGVVALLTLVLICHVRAPIRGYHVRRLHRKVLGRRGAFAGCAERFTAVRSTRPGEDRHTILTPR